MNYFLILLSCMFIKIEAGRILAIYPTPSISHQIVFRPITKELVKRGHELFVITADPMYPKGTAPVNLTEIDIHEISYKHFYETILKDMGQKENSEKYLDMIIKRIAFILLVQFQDKEVQNILKKDKDFFDLILVEAYMKPLLGIQYVFDAPIIQISSFGAIIGQYSEFGAPEHPILYPFSGARKLYNLSLFDKIMAILTYLRVKYIFYSHEEYYNEIMRKMYGKIIPLDENMYEKVAMLFLNEHPIWANNHPVSRNIIYIGGIHKTEKQPLPDDLQSYLDSSKNGVIYVSFGSNILPSNSSMKQTQILMKVFSELNYDVLMKWDTEDLPGKPDNVRISKWFPQSDILRHPNTKLFIMQGGLQSTEETIEAGVPVLCIPLFGDQWYNAEKYVHHKIGLKLDLDTFTDEDFKNAIKTIINDTSYKNNIIKLRTLVREKPVSPLNLATWWIDHVIKYGGKHLKPPSAHMSLAEYNEWKLIVIVASLIIITIAVIFYSVNRIIKLILKTFKEKND